MTGHFIVLEGADGAGTTTQARRLVAALEQRALAVRITAEPSTGPVGSMLRQILSGRLVCNGMGGPRAPGFQTMALLFAADRADHLEQEVLPLLREGVTVVSDRYDYSSVGYQGVAMDGTADRVAWIRELNRYARRPDLTLVLDAPFEVTKARRDQRAQSEELFEVDSIQRRLVDFYGELERHFPEDRIVHVSGNEAVEDVAATVLRHVDRLLAGS